MGEAKRRRTLAQPTVYHHTSILRTNLIWMSGKIEVEGKGAPAIHPQLGVIQADTKFRRDMEDFPALAWFTTQISVPNCLVLSSLTLASKETGESRRIEISDAVAHGITLNRLALGFRISDIPVVPWAEYHGYNTDEGKQLNETAREAGDNPEDWWVSEEAIDVMLASEVWYSLSRSETKLKRDDKYLKNVKDMVSMCRKNKVYIPPAWLKPEQAKALAARLNLPLASSTGNQA